MGSLRFVGRQLSTKQVTTITLTAYDVATTYKVTIGQKVVSTLGTGGTTAATATALYNLLTASTEPEFQEITWTNPSGSVIVGTAVTAGTPFTATATVSGGTGTLSQTATTANQSPNDFNDAVNYDTGSLPVNGDDLFIDESAVDILWNLGSLSGVTLTSLNIAMSFTGTIGLPEANAAGYREYRPQYMAIGATTINIGIGTGSGFSRCRLNQGSVQTTLNIFNTGAADDSPRECVEWKGTHASNVVNIYGGSLGVAIYGGEAATIATLRLAEGLGNTIVRCGATVTLAAITQEAGELKINTAVSGTINQLGGSLFVVGAGTIATANIAGTVSHNGTGTITTVALRPGGSLDLGLDARAITVTNCTMYAGSALADPAARGTYTNGIILSNCRLSDVSLDLGINRTLTVA